MRARQNSLCLVRRRVSREIDVLVCPPEHLIADRSTDQDDVSTGARKGIGEHMEQVSRRARPARQCHDRGFYPGVSRPPLRIERVIAALLLAAGESTRMGELKA